MRAHLAVAVLFLAAVGIFSQFEFEAEDDPWVAIVSLAIPLATGLLIGRWWTVSLAILTPVPFLLEPGEGDREIALWFEITGLVIWIAVPLAIGVGARKLAAHVSRRRAITSD